MSKPTVQVFENNDKIGAAAADFIAKQSAQAIKDRGVFTVAFSGGSLPEIVAKGLTTDENKKKIDFSKWVVVFADERCVPADHADSNYKACNQFIFSKVGIDKKQVLALDEKHLKEPDKAAAAYETQLREWVTTHIEAKAHHSGHHHGHKHKIPQIDLLLLGMGPDGHCCSLFPNHKLLKEDVKLVAGITDSPKPPDCRITLTYPVLNAARAALFICTGDAKKDVLKQIIDGGSNLPSALIKSESVTWFVDKAAAAKLEVKA